MKATINRSGAIFARAGGLWLERHAFVHAGSLAFYTLFSLAPVVIITVAVAGILFGEEAARGEIVTQLEHFVGREGAGAVEDVVSCGFITPRQSCSSVRRSRKSEPWPPAERWCRAVWPSV